MKTLIHNATLVLPERLLENGWLLLEDERILALGEQDSCPLLEQNALDAEGQLLLPGLIDLHCDAIEKLVEPRPGVDFDLELALREADWRLAGCGITTEFHAVTLDDHEFGVRSEGFVRDLSLAIRNKADLCVRHRLHARLELSSQRGYAVVAELVAQREADLISLMDHSPGQGQYANVEAYRDYVARTTNRSQAEIDAFIALKLARASEIPERLEAAACLVREAGLALATHDDDTATRVKRWPALGVSMSEFPTTMEAAQAAHDLGLIVCMGAPNVLRGKSSGGNLSALSAIQAGVTDALSSDYYPGAMLAAVFRLVQLEMLSLPEAVKLVTLNPARAVGMDAEYGSLEPGKLADVIVVGLNQRGLPRVRNLFVGGRACVSTHHRSVALPIAAGQN
ncbi:alpha-D-ribose 1-methylphosphonate 5-triphosphate diphosphatase [Ktedonosporobacter rubrisoli]|uniref:Alpha-D-ribose 1-methylphosphonate 5-triphosphate diphosphatase n=1 Tax=Ktedonosporobacter rubrisoli TaxID=2509675 RepID=A0A4P6JMC3_KTERU|nr:alpha-D-ribose 1-methylphosphonate 5-triphosphate diphosphatase [Ktedonosporobacter rubrisoli]QBD76385.1 alpha-D-ribose 1-methylphosphonate 5-triphosphate diphosphatase [Ktedonosporobacter rubrisoli]